MPGLFAPRTPLVEDDDDEDDDDAAAAVAAAFSNCDGDGGRSHTLVASSGNPSYSASFASLPADLPITIASA